MDMTSCPKELGQDKFKIHEHTTEHQ